MKNSYLSRSISDIGFYEFRKQLEYKSKINGNGLVIADRYFPSSKKCSSCGFVLDELPLSAREWRCFVYGMKHDRDVNASINLLNLGRVNVRSNACGEESSGYVIDNMVKLSSLKQEEKCCSIL